MRRALLCLSLFLTLLLVVIVSAGWEYSIALSNYEVWVSPEIDLQAGQSISITLDSRYGGWEIAIIPASEAGSWPSSVDTYISSYADYEGLTLLAYSSGDYVSWTADRDCSVCILVHAMNIYDAETGYSVSSGEAYIIVSVSGGESSESGGMWGELKEIADWTWDNTFGKLIKQLKKLAEMLSAIEEKIAALGRAIENFCAKIKSFFVSLGNSIKNAVEGFGEALASLGGAINNALSRLGHLLAAPFEAFFNAAKGFISRVGEAAAGVVEAAKTHWRHILGAIGCIAVIVGILLENPIPIILGIPAVGVAMAPSLESAFGSLAGGLSKLGAAFTALSQGLGGMMPLLLIALGILLIIIVLLK